MVDTPARPMTDQAMGLLMESFNLDAPEAAYLLSTWSHLCAVPPADIAAAVLCAVGTGDTSGCDLRVVRQIERWLRQLPLHDDQPTANHPPTSS